MSDTHSVQHTALHETEDRQGYRFWPTHILDQAIIFHLLIGVLITLAILLPRHLAEPATPLIRPEIVKPQWYFLPFYQAAKYLPPPLVATGVAGLVLFVLFWPFIITPLERRFTGRIQRIVGVLVVLAFLGLGVLGMVSGRTYTILGEKVRFTRLGVPYAAPPGDAVSGEAPRTPR